MIEELVRRSDPFAVADAISRSTFRDEMIEFASKRQDDPRLRDVFVALLAIRAATEGLPFVATQIRQLVATGQTSSALMLAKHLSMTEELWDLLAEVGEPLHTEYWKALTFVFRNETRASDDRAVRELLGVGNLEAAFKHVLHENKKIATDLSLDVLSRAVASESAWARVKGTESLSYWLPLVFDGLAASVPPDTLGPLVLRFALRVDDNLHGLRWLTPMFEKNPSLFVGLCAGTVPGNVGGGTSDDEDVAARAGRVLYGWRGVPGDSARAEDRDRILLAWSREVLRNAETLPHPHVVDTPLCLVFARASSQDGRWPPRAVREILREIPESRHFRGQLSVARQNMRGATTRGMVEGGRQEVVLAARYELDANELRCEWPEAADVLDHIARCYRSDASRNEAEANSFAKAEGLERTALDGLDLLVSIALAAADVDADASMSALAAKLGVERAEVKASLDVLTRRKIVRTDGRLNRLRLRQFLLQDPPPFPLAGNQVASAGIGLPTGTSGPELSNELRGEAYVMPLSTGGAQGRVVPPIHGTAPTFAHANPRAYVLLSLLDALRVAYAEGGRARDAELARKKLTELL
jgi:hypothetical protein